jgi:hypothetical protein
MIFSVFPSPPVEGLNDLEIADALGVSDAMVSSCRRRLGLETKWKMRRFTDQQRDRTSSPHSRPHVRIETLDQALSVSLSW